MCLVSCGPCSPSYPYPRQSPRAAPGKRSMKSWHVSRPCRSRCRSIATHSIAARPGDFVRVRSSMHSTSRPRNQRAPLRSSPSMSGILRGCRSPRVHPLWCRPILRPSRCDALGWPGLSPPNRAMHWPALRAESDCQGVGWTQQQWSEASTRRVGLRRPSGIAAGIVAKQSLHIELHIPERLRPHQLPGSAIREIRYPSTVNRYTESVSRSGSTIQECGTEAR